MAGYDGGLDPRQPRDLKVPEYTALVRICCLQFLYKFTLCRDGPNLRSSCFFSENVGDS